jgi:hypothetical protein
MAYGFAALIVTGLPGLFAAIAALAVGLAHIVRGIRITRQVALVERKPAVPSD